MCGGDVKDSSPADIDPPVPPIVIVKKPVMVVQEGGSRVAVVQSQQTQKCPAGAPAVGDAIAPPALSLSPADGGKAVGARPRGNQVGRQGSAGSVRNNFAFRLGER